MTKRYILNYIGGSKGDFLCNFINNIPVSLDERNASPSDFGFLKSLTYRNFNDTDIKLINENSCLIFPAHFAHKIPIEFLNNYNFEIINFVYDSNVLSTIYIEYLFKNLPKKLQGKDKLGIIAGRTKQSAEAFKQFKEVEYFIDINLLLEKKEINNENRIKYLEKRLKNFYFPYKSTGTNEISYSKIFIDNDFSELKNFFKINDDKLKFAIANTWLPSTVYAWGKEWDIENYGYRKW